jgi:hypothetical protein
VFVSTRINVQMPPSIFSCLNTRKAGPILGVMKIGPSRIPNRIVQFPRIRPAHLQLGAHPANDLRLCRSEIQKAGIVISKIFIPVEPPMHGPWGPPSMMYTPCPPWAGWYIPWALSSMPFHLGWLGPAEGFGYGGYYTGDDRYGHVGHQQDSRILRQENRMVWNPKPDVPVS